MRILVTGGAGYIGSHTVLCLLEAGHEVSVIDTLENGHREALRRVEQMTARRVDFHLVDVTDADAVGTVFTQAKPDAVIHFAGLKAVHESVADPLRYYHVNVSGSITLLQAMEAHGVQTIVFSSSATVYGMSDDLPYTEEHPVGPVNPYGQSKRLVEEVLRDWAATGGARRAVALRYFNPVGAHSSGQIGEDPRGTPNNLMPYIAQVAAGRRDYLSVFGDDYKTRDGTGERDYIHVMDLARAHVSAVERAHEMAAFELVNLGTGRGTTVLELVAAFEQITGQAVSYKVTPRRDGDVAQSWADPSKAKRLLNWSAQHSVEDMVRSSWLWQSKNPNGFEG